MHPDWEALDSYDKQDMAIYRTSTPIKFNENVLPVCLPTSPKDYSGSKAIIAGWGLTIEGGKSSQLLQEARIKVITEDECKVDTTVGSLYSPDSMLCAFAPSKDACQGDSGGPLFLQTGANRYEQIGVTSFGIGCGKDLPAIYTKVSTSLEWIHSVIKNADTCQDADAA
ncbi:trypsin-1-like [Culicoides brevitarsis]|uniref:trypsin-1-like n=1 Tax=Culicoides brevitarsis TaxID=469753 RepID=UPI00307C58B7